VVQSDGGGAEKFWDRHVSRPFAFSNVKTIVVNPGVRPMLYTLPMKPATLQPGDGDKYNIRISTAGADFEIEFHAFDGGDVVP
jgi:hypothetical protein